MMSCRAFAYPGRSVSDGVEDLLDDRPRRGGGRPRPASGGGPCCAGEGKQVLAFGVVELQRVRDALEHLVRGAREIAALHPDVVVDAHAGQQRDLFSPQPLDAPVTAAVGGQPGLTGSDPSAAGGEEVTDLDMVVHVFHGRRHHPGEGGTGITWKARHSPEPTLRA